MFAVALVDISLGGFSCNKQRYLMPEGINARVSRYYICWHSITIVCYTFVQQLEICN